MKRFYLFALSGIIFATQASMVNAANNVSFPSCVSPSGNVIANYENGTHGILNSGSRIGKDTVYSLGDGNAMQCFCSEHGHGIQTNWQKASNLTDDEIKVLESEGWLYVPDGLAWGLSQGPYVAKNIDFACYSSSTVESSSANSIVQSASGSLATTGNLLFIAEIIGFGALLTLIGIAIRQNTK